MQISNSINNNMSSVRENVLDALKSGNVSDGLKATDLFLNSNSGTCVSISKTDDVATLAHQLLGGKMTQVNTVV